MSPPMKSASDILATIENKREFTSEDAAQHCQWLEQGRILFFPTVPFDFSRADIEFLLDQRQTGAQYHKNIAYRPLQDDA